MSTHTRFLGIIVTVALVHLGSITAAEVAVDTSRYNRACGVDVNHEGQRIEVGWPMPGGERGRLVLDLRPGKPLIRELGIASGVREVPRLLLQGVEPVTFVTVGTRQAPAGRPPEMSIWNTFFDKQANRFFVTNGEIVLKDFTAGGKESGAVLMLAPGGGASCACRSSGHFRSALRRSSLATGARSFGSALT